MFKKPQNDTVVTRCNLIRINDDEIAYVSDAVADTIYKIAMGQATTSSGKTPTQYKDVKLVDNVDIMELTDKSGHTFYRIMGKGKLYTKSAKSVLKKHLSELLDSEDDIIRAAEIEFTTKSGNKRDYIGFGFYIKDDFEKFKSVYKDYTISADELKESHDKMSARFNN